MHAYINTMCAYISCLYLDTLFWIVITGVIQSTPVFLWHKKNRSGANTCFKVNAHCHCRLNIEKLHLQRLNWCPSEPSFLQSNDCLCEQLPCLVGWWSNETVMRYHPLEMWLMLKSSMLYCPSVQKCNILYPVGQPLRHPKASQRLILKKQEKIPLLEEGKKKKKATPYARLVYIFFRRLSLLSLVFLRGAGMERGSCSC